MQGDNRPPCSPHRQAAARALAVELLATSPNQVGSPTHRLASTASAVLEREDRGQRIDLRLDDRSYAWVLDRLAAELAPLLRLVSEVLEDTTVPQDVRDRVRAGMVGVPAAAVDAWVWARSRSVLVAAVDRVGSEWGAYLVDRSRRPTSPRPEPSSN